MRKFLSNALLLAVLAAFGADSADGQQSVSDSITRSWALRTLVADKVHSSVQFRASHWGIVDIIGWFEDYEITVERLDLDFTDSKIRAQVNPASVRMPNSDMANNLIAQGFFKVEKYPSVTFESSQIRKQQEDTYLIAGQLTMNGITRRTMASAQFRGYVYPPGTGPCFKATFDIVLSEFGIGDSDTLAANQRPTIGDTVAVTLNLRMEPLVEGR